MKLSHFLFLVWIAPGLVNSSASMFDVAKIEQITGWKGKWNETEWFFKITSPRTDVKVAVDGVPMAPFMGLTSWAAFTGSDNSNLMVMGDTVLFEDEVNRMMDAAFQAGIEHRSGARSGRDSLRFRGHGAVVNVNDNRIPMEAPAPLFGGEVVARYGSVDLERSGAISLQLAATKHTVLHGDFTIFRTDSRGIPGFALSQPLRDLLPPRSPRVAASEKIRRATGFRFHRTIRRSGCRPTGARSRSCPG